MQKTVLRFNDTPTHIIHRLQPHSSSSFCDETQGWAAMVACALAAVQPAAALAPCGRRSLSGHLRRLPSPRLSGKLVAVQRALPFGFSMHDVICAQCGVAGRIRISRSVVAKVAKDSSESSGSVVRYVKSYVSFLPLIHGLL